MLVVEKRIDIFARRPPAIHKLVALPLSLKDQANPGTTRGQPVCGVNSEG
eukprot:GAFH01002897.1.p8 GENE.GAFH01002897.1~~GAFH01002897.1.p8  ORF type:complete len:50 (-),score=6.64 GAFH01002897.1:546-695(-)